MSKFLITVNGTQYEVEVSEAGASAPVVAAPVAPAPAAPAPVTPAAPAAGGEAVECPMPGTIISVNVQNGQSIKRGDLVCILEAMKMENEILSPVDGVVSSVIAPGTAVNTGDIIAVIS
ncbi:MAG: biotin/lipoyl-containing protein [Christensenellales bacterium]|jgi:biotin carboxyl carrier protein